MNSAQTHEVTARAAVYAALGDVTRLRIVDYLSLSDATASELGAAFGIPSNLLAHHVNLLVEVGLAIRRQSEGDGRRNYLSLAKREVEPGLDARSNLPLTAQRVVFVCTANTARSHLAAALWRQRSPIAARSAGTHPGQKINPGVFRTARRRGLYVPDVAPTRLPEAVEGGEFLITVCDRAHEDLAAREHVHWSIPDPVPDGSAAAFDRSYTELAERIQTLVPRLSTGTDSRSTEP